MPDSSNAHRTCVDCGEFFLVGMVTRPRVKRCLPCRETHETKMAERDARRPVVTPEEWAIELASESFMRKFTAKFEKCGDCWPWSGSTDRSGYGKMKVLNLYPPAHRLAYELWCGSIPDGELVAQRCRNRLCVNPEHLFLITIEQRQLRGYDENGYRIGKTICTAGHPLTGDNVYLWDGQPNQRKCKACRLEVGVRYVERKEEATTIPYTRAQLRDRLAFFDNRCWMCGDPDAKSTDHVKPLTSGGLNILANIRPACKSCNSRKGPKWPWPTSLAGFLAAKYATVHADAPAVEQLAMP